MTISETISRECCQDKDLRPYRGKILEAQQGNYLLKRAKFCIYCGQVWIPGEREGLPILSPMELQLSHC